MGIKDEIDARFFDKHVDLRAYWEREQRKIKRSKNNYVLYHILILAWVPVVILLLPLEGWFLQAAALFSFLFLLGTYFSNRYGKDPILERFTEISEADQKSWHATFNGKVYREAHKKIHARMKQERDQITREGMWKIEEVINSMKEQCQFSGSVKIDSAYRNQPHFKYDFSGIDGCQLRLYRQEGSMLESVEAVLKSEHAILIMQKYEHGEGSFIDYDAKDGETYNYYAFIYFPVKSSKGEVVTTAMKLLYPEPLDKTSAPEPTFVTVLPKEFQANLAHGFMAERVTVPRHITAKERAEFEKEKIQAKSELQYVKDSFVTNSGDILKKAEALLKTLTSKEARQREMETFIEMIQESDFSDSIKEKTTNELLKMIN